MFFLWHLKMIFFFLLMAFFNIGRVRGFNPFKGLNHGLRHICPGAASASNSTVKCFIFWCLQKRSFPRFYFYQTEASPNAKISLMDKQYLVVKNLMKFLFHAVPQRKSTHWRFLDVRYDSCSPHRMYFITLRSHWLLFLPILY